MNVQQMSANLTVFESEQEQTQNQISSSQSAELENVSEKVLNLSKLSETLIARLQSTNLAVTNLTFDFQQRKTVLQNKSDNDHMHTKLFEEVKIAARGKLNTLKIRIYFFILASKENNFKL